MPAIKASDELASKQSNQNYYMAIFISEFIEHVYYYFVAMLSCSCFAHVVILLFCTPICMPEERVCRIWEFNWN